MVDDQQILFVDRAFPHEFDVRPEMAPDARLPHYGGRTGMRLRVRPKSEDPFSLCIDAPGDKLSLLTWPNPQCFLIKATGQLVDVGAPRNTVKLAALEGHRVAYHLLLPAQQLALLGFCGGILAYGSTGVQWLIDSEQIGMQAILDTFEDELFVIAHDENSGRVRRNRFDVYSGKWLGESALL